MTNNIRRSFLLITLVMGIVLGGRQEEPLPEEDGGSPEGPLKISLTRFVNGEQVFHHHGMADMSGRRGTPHVTVQCRKLSEKCRDNSNCCSRNCCNNECRKSDSRCEVENSFQCNEQGQGCKVNDDCCSKNCCKGKCAHEDTLCVVSCLPLSKRCTRDDQCCSGKCSRFGFCQKHEIMSPPSLDLFEDDLWAMCRTVNPNTRYVKPNRCVYMKWESCPEGSPNPKKPCGWYRQSFCDEHTRNRRKVMVDQRRESASKTWTDPIGSSRVVGPRFGPMRSFSKNKM